ncbi:lipoprotein, putative [Marinomonas sp. MED121]|nr:lipoprotein, putative [Marinomonas sp. MED121]
MMIRVFKDLFNIAGTYAVLALLCASVVQAQWPIPQKNQAFSSYLQQTDAYLMQHKSWLVSANKQVEKTAVMPFEIKPGMSCKENGIGVLLVHGLSDSSYSLRSMGDALAKRCFWVRSILLPGHGTKAEDLIDAKRQEWRAAVKAAVYNFAQETDSLYIAGYSTGATLAVDYMQKPEVNLSGLILFSPLLKINTSADWLTPIVGLFVNWLDRKTPDDYAKYASIPVPAMAEVFHLATEVRKGLRQQALTIPVFIAMSAEDNTVNSKLNLKYFKRHMTNAASRLWLYSNKAVNFPDPRIEEINSYDESLKITGFSHMSAHMSPLDPYYGKAGSYRVCQWYKDDELAQCKQDVNGWSGEKGRLLESKSPHGARLSWNPDFERLVDYISQYMLQHAVKH